MQPPFTMVPSTPENLENATKNVIATSEEVGYNPEEDSNWSILPNEMKEEVLERMDFLTRTRLAAASKIDKEMVERKKFPLNGLRVETNIMRVDRYSLDCCYIKGYSLVGDHRVRFEFQLDHIGSAERFEETMRRIFATCDVKCFFFNNFRPPREFSSQGIAQLVPFQFERFVCGENWEVNVFILKNCVGLKSVSIDAYRLYCRYPATRENVFDTSRFGDTNENVLQLPAVLGAEHMELANIRNPEAIHPTIRTWLETHTPIGKSIELIFWPFLESYVNEFRDKIIQNSDDHLLLRMIDADRQLLFHRIREKDFISHVLIKVIPVGLPESEYTTHPFNKSQYSLPHSNHFTPYIDHMNNCRYPT